MLRLLAYATLLFAACQELPALPTQATDASRWFDVQLANATLTDAIALTLAVDDAGVAVVPVEEHCEVSDASAEGSTTVPDASDASVDAAACTTPIGPGDLVFDEVMIATEVGSDDKGQWIEVRSTKACAVDLNGLEATAPHGQSFRTVDVTTDVWLPPGGFFIIADTVDPTLNNALPGLVLAWTGSPADALHKTSDTITMTFGGLTVDSISYPDKKRALATSMAFPISCNPRERIDFTTWLPSVASWTDGFFGTPNSPNDDVTCPPPKTVACTKSRHTR